MEGEVLARAINDGVFAKHKFVVTQVRENLVVPVFNRHGLPLVGVRPTDAFAQVGGDDADVAVDRGVDLEVIGVDLRNAVVAAATASHETQVARLPRKFEVELYDCIVERRVSKKDSFGFGCIDVGAQQPAVTQGEIGLEAPAAGDGGGVEVFREEELARGTHQRVRRSGRLGICCGRGCKDAGERERG